MGHNCLMIPGPVEIEPEVLKFLNEPIKAHYGPQWVELFNETRSQTQQVFQTTNELLIMPGSGTLGIDACLASVLGDDGKALVLSNGFFGHRLQEMAQTYTNNAIVHQKRWGETLALDEVESLIQSEKPRLVVMVHCETSTCILNPVEEVSKLCQQHNVLLMVDAISSLGAANLPVDDWHVDLCVTGLQKALGCPPGLALVSVSDKAWSMMDENAPHGWYQNLQVWRRYAEDWAHFFPHPVTQNSGLFKALHWSTGQLLDEGLSNVFQRHLHHRDQLRQTVRDLGLELLIDDDAASPSVTGIVLDERIAPQELIQQMVQKHGILIGGGLGALAERVVRIGHMGPQAKPERIDPLLQALKDLLG